MTSPAASRYHRLTVQAVVQAADSHSLLFHIPPELEAAFRYKPGQFLTLRLPIDGRWLPRCYSMSSAPAWTMRRASPSRQRDARRARLQLGVRYRARWPHPRKSWPRRVVFTPRTLDGDFVLLAGGSGIAPVFSICAVRCSVGRHVTCSCAANHFLLVTW